MRKNLLAIGGLLLLLGAGCSTATQPITPSPEPLPTKADTVIEGSMEEEDINTVSATVDIAVEEGE
ncbi:MAG: hypothetical protein ABII02_02975 [Candidatus Magasanikbacteria bacterium]